MWRLRSHGTLHARPTRTPLRNGRGQTIKTPPREQRTKHIGRTACILHQTDQGIHRVRRRHSTHPTQGDCTAHLSTRKPKSANYHVSYVRKTRQKTQALCGPPHLPMARLLQTVTTSLASRCSTCGMVTPSFHTGFAVPVCKEIE